MNELIMNQENKQEVSEQIRFNLNDVIIPEVSDTSKGATKPGIINFVYADSGKRTTISSNLYKELGHPDTVQVAFEEKGIFIAKKLPKGTSPLVLREECGKESKKAHLYNKILLDKIIEQYGLDFSERSSITFHEVEYFTESDITVAYIKLLD